MYVYRILSACLILLSGLTTYERYAIVAGFIVLVLVLIFVVYSNFKAHLEIVNLKRQLTSVRLSIWKMRLQRSNVFGSNAPADDFVIRTL